MTPLRALALLALVACYRPPAFDDPCAIVCTPEVGCPDGLSCVDGRCGTSCGGTITVDGTTPLGCFGDDLVEVCPDSGTVLPETLQLAADIDTDDVCPHELVPPTGYLPVCVFAAKSIRITDRVRFHGARPVVLFAVHDIAVEATGVLDLSQGGAGSQPPDCPTDTAPAAIEAGAAAGGAGGSFGTAGGSGGVGGLIDSQQSAAPPITPTFLRGGCDGHPGGAAADGSAGGQRGRSGGAIWLLAGDRIEIEGRIHANGMGGRGAPLAKTGGGGGGTGGFIGLEAKQGIHLYATAILVANGAGGGGGSLNAAGMNGQVGRMNATSAAGGAGGGSMDIDGGYGWPGLDASLDGHGDKSGGGGGGGGGAGFVRILGELVDEGAIISPQGPNTTGRHAP